MTIKLGSLFPKTTVPKATSAAGSILLETARKSLNPWLQAPVCMAAAQPALRELWGLFHIRESCEGMWQGGDRGAFVFAFGEKHKGGTRLQMCSVQDGAGLRFWKSTRDHVCSDGGGQLKA